jgi:uncharacterized protein
MFRRRGKLGWGRRLRDFLWPQAGFRRAGSYILHRVRRLPGSPYSIAAGFACGAAISFTPYMGFHILLGGLLAWLIGGNVIAAAIGTVVGNPWTFPFIWVGVYRLGCLMTGCDAGQALPDELTLTYIFDNAISILLPMSVGAVPVAVVVWFAFFWPVRELVADYQILRRHRRERRREVLRQRVKETNEETST